ncbi:MAG TPA: phage tail protein [Chloroflexota bacterium]
MATSQLAPGQIMAKALGATPRSRANGAGGAGGIAAQESMYLRFLPGMYQEDPFLKRFLMIFESVLGPIDRSIANLPIYTEPELAPEQFLPWLAQWVAVTLDSAWPLERQRALIANAVEIYRWRGTKYGLKLHIQSYTGHEPLIAEYRSGFVLGKESGMGWTTQLLSTPPNPLLFVVTAPVDNPRAINAAILRQIIEEDKPAHTTYRLRVVLAGAARAGEGRTIQDRRSASPAAGQPTGGKAGE